MGIAQSGQLNRQAEELTNTSMVRAEEEALQRNNHLPCQPHGYELQNNQESDMYVNTMYDSLSLQDLIEFAFQAACGMEYLSSRKIFHGDLAARNILLADNNIVKICDFGLAKNIYKEGVYDFKGKKKQLPVMWLAIECLRDGICTIQSDVWSFGVVLWEIFTLAASPYPGIENSNLLKELQSGHRMEMPAYATDDLYSVMKNCWNSQPDMRPSFAELVDKLGLMLDETVQNHFVALNEEYMKMNNEWRTQPGHTDYFAKLNFPAYLNVAPPVLEKVPAQAYRNIPTDSPTCAPTDTIPGYFEMTPLRVQMGGRLDSLGSNSGTEGTVSASG